MQQFKKEKEKKIINYLMDSLGVFSASASRSAQRSKLATRMRTTVPFG
jgi:hypothetical protein